MRVISVIILKFVLLSFLQLLWLELTTYDDGVALALTTALLESSYEMFRAICELNAVLSLHLSEEMVKGNYYNIRPDGWCWYTLYANLFLMRQGHQPRTLCYEDPEDVAILSEAMDYYINHLTPEQRNYVESRHNQVWKGS